MKANFAACLAETLSHEGGWADDPRDAGGATMKGVTLATYRRWKPGATKAQLRAITDAELAMIYRRDYWEPVWGDDLPAGLDLVAFDAAVNSGVSRGAKWLQSALGVTADGKVGLVTLAAARAADPREVIVKACDNRMAFLRTAKHTRTGAALWPTYGKGWTRRVEAVRATALSMAAPTRPVPKPAPKPVTMPSPVPPPAPAATETTTWVLGALVAAAVVAFFIFGG